MEATNRDHVDRATTSGIRDPEDSGRWLVRPWPVRASFGEVVSHFMMAYAVKIQGGTISHQLAYFQGYLAALQNAPADEPTHPSDCRRRDEMIACIADCLAVLEDKQSTTGPID